MTQQTAQGTIPAQPVTLTQETPKVETHPAPAPAAVLFRDLASI